MTKGMLKNVNNIQNDGDGRLQKFDICIEEHVLTICNIYAPNSDTPDFFNKLCNNLETGSEHKILVGDFNLVMDVSLDRIGSSHNKEKSLTVIKNICDEYLLTDIWRAKNQESHKYSWYRSRPRLTASRIDFGLVSLGMVDNCENTGYVTGLKSDHLAFYLYLQLNQNERGRGY